MLNHRIGRRGFSVRRQAGALKQNLIAIPLVLAALGAMVWALLPASYGTDLTLIGKGKPVIAVIYDNENGASLKLMDNYNEIRGDYGDQIVFLAVDVNAPAGREFLIRQQVGSADALYYSPSGEKLFVLHGPHDGAYLKNTINKVFGI